MEYTQLQSNTKVSDTPAILNANFANIKTELEGKADATSLKKVATSGSYNDLTDKPTIPSAYNDTALKQRVTALENAGYLTEVPSEYVTETELSSKGYLTAHQSLNGYATESYVTAAISNALSDIEGGSY